MKFWLTSCVLLLGMSIMANAQTPQAKNNAAAGVDRTTPPAVSEPAPVTIPDVEKRTLSNGIPVWFTERHNTPLATVAMFVRAGAVKETPDKLGTASLTAELLDEGTEKYDAMQFAEQTDNLGAYFSIDQGYFGSTISLTIPAKRLNDGLDLMEQSILHPTFPQKEMDLIKGRTLTGFLQQRQTPSTLASCAFIKKIYESEPNNRQGSALDGTAQTFSAITHKDVEDFYAKYYIPGNASIAVTGDVDADKVMEMLEKRFGSWKNPKPSDEKVVNDFKSGLGKDVKDLAAASAIGAAGQGVRGKVSNGGRTIYVVDRPGAPQSVLRVGCVGFARSTNKFFPIKVMNTALGGSFMSRLNQNLRERNGYTYGARSTFTFRVEPGPFVISADVQADKTVPALKEIMKEVSGMSKKMPDDEIGRTRRYICYSYPASFETSIYLAQRILDMQLYNLPDDYYSTYVGNISKVGNDDMGVLRNTFFSPDNMTMVVVGDAKLIAEQAKQVPGWKVELIPVDDFMGPEVQP